MTTWICAPPCGSANDVAMRVCDLCGADRPRQAVTPKTPTPTYREVPARTFVREAPSAETVDAINALYTRLGVRRRFGEAVPAALSEPTPRERADHAQRQAAILRAAFPEGMRP